jgi:hypothetical protein
VCDQSCLSSTLSGCCEEKNFWPHRNFNFCVKNLVIACVLVAEPKETVIRRRKELGNDITL